MAAIESATLSQGFRMRKNKPQHQVLASMALISLFHGDNNEQERIDYHSRRAGR